jgi:hypothetical protein
MPLLTPLHDILGELSNYTAVASKLWALLIGATIISAIGLADDIKGVNFSPLLKFLGQVLAAFSQNEFYRWGLS